MKHLNNTTLVIFAIVIIFVIKHLALVQCVPLSPCPQLFYYEYDGRHWNGVLKIHAHIYSRYRGERMSVQLTFSAPRHFVHATTSADGITRAGGNRLELYYSMDKTFAHILANRAIVYRVTFSNQLISPTLLQININRTTICTNMDNNNRYNAFGIVYRYRVDTSLVLPTAQTDASPSYLAKSAAAGQDIYVGTRRQPVAIPLALNSVPDAPSSGYKIRMRQELENICGRFEPQSTSRSQSITIARRPHIVHGTWPWLVAIYVKKRQGVELKCTGNLISNKLILTAAQCFWSHITQPSEILLVMGRYNLRNWTEESAILSDAQSIHLHPDFRGDGHRYDADLAIVRPKEPFEYNAWIRPLCLWPYAQPEDARPIATFVGWQPNDDIAIANLPRTIQMSIVSRDDCILSNAAFSYITSGRSLCGGQIDGQGPCKSDVGAAMAQQRNGIWFLRGVFSAALADPETYKCDSNNFVVFTDVPKFTAWINEFF